jgi:hypothetical protein
MTIFTSQFDRARPFADAYAGRFDDPAWRPPGAATATLAAAGLSVVAVGALAATADPDAPAAWGEGWDAGWDTSAPPAEQSTDDGSAWMHRGEYTDAGVGGDGDSFYFIDGDASLIVE